MSLLGIAYVKARMEEREEENKRQKEEELFDLKIKVFCYAVRHELAYSKVVEMINRNEITIEEIKKDG